MEKKFLAIIVLILIASLSAAVVLLNHQQHAERLDDVLEAIGGAMSHILKNGKGRQLITRPRPLSYTCSESRQYIRRCCVAIVTLNTTTGTTLQDFFNNSMGNGVTGVSRYTDYALSSLGHITLAGQPADKVVWQATIPEN